MSENIPTETSSSVTDPPIHVRDYMCWSILNIFLGGFILGFIVVGLSTQIQKCQERGDLQKAKRLSCLVLLSNLLITILCCGLIALLTIYLMYFMSYLNDE